MRCRAASHRVSFGMITSHPLPALPSPPRGAAKPPPSKTRAPTGSWRYNARRRSRTAAVSAMLCSAALHALVLFAFNGKQQNAPPPVAEDEPMLLLLTMPELKELDEPDLLPEEDLGPAEEAGTLVPMQADAPQIPNPSDFVQPLDFASLVEQPDLSNVKILTIPGSIRRGGKLGDGIGKIFDLADLDRAPVAVVQPPPVVPSSLRSEGGSATVHVEFVVNVDGRAMQAFAVESTDRRFDDAAVFGVSKWKFRPGMKGGRKVNTRMIVPIVFKITKGP